MGTSLAKIRNQLTDKTSSRSLVLKYQEMVSVNKRGKKSFLYSTEHYHGLLSSKMETSQHKTESLSVSSDVITFCLFLKRVTKVLRVSLPTSL